MQFDCLLELEPAVSESEAEAYLMHSQEERYHFPAFFARSP